MLAIEPIVSAGDGRIYTDGDAWTVRTVDGGLAAHHENTVVITASGPVPLTAA